MLNGFVKLCFASSEPHLTHVLDDRMAAISNKKQI